MPFQAWMFRLIFCDQYVPRISGTEPGSGQIQRCTATYNNSFVLVRFDRRCLLYKLRQCPLELLAGKSPQRLPSTFALTYGKQCFENNTNKCPLETKLRACMHAYQFGTHLELYE